jgi:hypothetical protein
MSRKNNDHGAKTSRQIRRIAERKKKTVTAAARR